jgi:hypothetical protein
VGRNVRLLAGSANGARVGEVVSNLLGLTCFQKPRRFGTPRFYRDLAFVDVIIDESWWSIIALKRSDGRWQVIDQAWGNDLPVI